MQGTGSRRIHSAVTCRPLIDPIINHSSIAHQPLINHSSITHQVPSAPLPAEAVPGEARPGAVQADAEGDTDPAQGRAEVHATPEEPRGPLQLRALLPRMQVLPHTASMPNIPNIPVWVRTTRQRGGAVSCSVMQCHAVSCSVMQCHAVSCSGMQWHAMSCSLTHGAM